MCERFKEPYAKQAFLAFLNDSNLNLRSIAKAIHHLCLVVMSLDTEVQLQIEVAALLTVYRAVNYHSYREFIQGGKTSEETSQNFLARVTRREQGTHTQIDQAFFEAVVWSVNNAINDERWDPYELAKTIAQGKKGINPIPEYQMLEKYTAHIAGYGLKRDQLDIHRLIRRIELLTEGLPSQIRPT